MLNSNEVEITNKRGEVKVIKADNIIIATGSRPRTIPTIAVDHKTIMTSDSIESIEDYPKSLVILGAGVIGCEYATIFSNFGKTKVYMITHFGKTSIQLGDFQQLVRGDKELPIYGLPDVVTAMRGEPYKNGRLKITHGESYI